jgi:type I restriction enzyme S subunit
LRNDAGVWGTTFHEKGTIVLRSTEQLVDGSWRLRNPARLVLPDNQQRAARLDVGDLVVTKSSGSSLHIGKTSLVTQKIADLACCFSNFMQRLRLSTDVSPRFASLLLNSRIGREQFVYQSTTTTGLGNLNGTILGNCTFAFPPLDEQAEIVRFLDCVNGRLEHAIRAKRKVIALLNEQKQAVIHRAVTRGLDPSVPRKPSGIPWLGDIPQHWEIRRLSSVARFASGKAHEQFFDPKGEHVCVTARFVSTGGASRKFSSINVCPATSGDVLMVMSDLPNGRALARAYLVRDDKSYAVNQRVCRLTPHAIEPRFLAYWANRSPHFLRHDDGMNQTHLSNYDFKTMPVALPSGAEQTRIADDIDLHTKRIESSLSCLEREIELLREYRTRLVADVMTGKLDVREAAGELHSIPEEAVETTDAMFDPTGDVDDFDAEELLSDG